MLIVDKNMKFKITKDWVKIFCDNYVIGDYIGTYSGFGWSNN